MQNKNKKKSTTTKGHEVSELKPVESNEQSNLPEIVHPSPELLDRVVEKTRGRILGGIDQLQSEINESDERKVGAQGNANDWRNLHNEKQALRDTNGARIAELEQEWTTLGGEELDAAIKDMEAPDEYGTAGVHLNATKRNMYEALHKQEIGSVMQTAEELRALQSGTPEYDAKLEELDGQFNKYAETFELSKDRKDELLEVVSKAGGYTESQPIQPTAEEFSKALEGKPTTPETPSSSEGKQPSPENPGIEPEVEKSEVTPEVKALQEELRTANERMEKMTQDFREAMARMQATIDEQNQRISELMTQQTNLLERLEQRGAQSAVTPADLNPTPGAPAEPFGPIPNRFTAENNPAASAQNKGLFKKAWEYLFGSKEKDNSQESEPKDRRMKKLGRHAVLWDSIDNAYARNGREVPAIEIYKGKDFNEWLGEVLNSTSSDINSMSDFESLVARMAGKKSIKVMKDNDTGKVELKIGGKKADDATAIWALWPMVYGSRPPQQAQQRFAEQGR